MPRVRVVVPWADPGCPYRRRAWQFLSRQYRHPIVEAPAPAVPWVKADAVNPAVAATRADIVVVADADVWPTGLARAIQAVEGGAPWVVPHRGVFRLTEGATRTYIDRRGLVEVGALPLDRPAYLGMVGGGAIVARRDVLVDVPLDRRFVGWGQEDESWGAALETLHGPPVRIKRPLVHLWHPAQARLDTRVGSVGNWLLRRRYFQAKGDPAATRRIIEECKSTP